jgi:hypothetical protein
MRDDVIGVLNEGERRARMALLPAGLVGALGPEALWFRLLGESIA